MNFPLLGHQRILEHLKSEAASGRLHHAHLFLGPEHVGKTKMALTLAVHLQGADEHGVAKKQLLEGLDADTLLFLDAGEGMGIEAVRGLIERSNQGHLKPYLVVVIENLARLRPEASTALLKTLEEPHPGLLFLLTAHQEEDVLPTLRSRAQVHVFQSLPDEEMTPLLEGNPLAERLLFFAMGRPGKLIRLMEDPAYLEIHETVLRDLDVFLERPTVAAAFALTRKYESSDFLPEFLDVLLRHCRTWLFKGPPQALAHVQVTDVLDALEDAKLALRNNVNSKLLLDQLLLMFVP
ncbi:AAA family ATPase [Candidatus Peregrinibacteria bacterium]|nr:MAG: AAA family ATPase [Candidatus Peregrinibacteria bacterium]